MRFVPLTFPSDSLLAVQWRKPLWASWAIGLWLIVFHIATALQTEQAFQALVMERTSPFRRLVGGQVSGLVTDGQWWRLASSIWVHVDGLHLTLNVVALVGLGRLLEPWIGARRLLGWFCIGGIFASLCSHLTGVQASDGASGGAFALLGALVWLGMDSRVALDAEATWILGWPLRALAALNILLPLFLPFLDGVGHIAGFVAGGFLLSLSRRTGFISALLDLCAIGVVGLASTWALFQVF